MRKLILLFTFIYVTYSGFGSHLMGGQITANQISGLTYEVTLTLYRDATGITMPTSATIEFYSIQGGFSTTVNAPNTGVVNFLNNVEEYTYTCMVTFPSPSDFLISWSSCCRNNAILNIQNAGSQSFFIFNQLNVDTIYGNSSPLFLNPPVVLAQVNDTFYYNPLPFDADGDSLAWSIDTPLGVDQFDLLPYVVPSAITGGSFSMNPLTGEISWIPNTLGNFVASFIIEEYRNGIKIGEIRRDMQYIVVDVPGNTDKAIVNTSGWPVDPNGNFYFDIDINTPFTLSIDVSDAGGDSIFVEANGEPFLIQNNPATWTNLNTAPGISENEFSWNTTANEMRINPYIVAFRIFETHGNYTLVKDKTVLLNVSDFTSVNENTSDNIIGNIYPNPSTREFFINVNVEKSTDLQLAFINQLGQEIKRFDKKLNAGQNLIYLSDLKLPSGVYFVNLKINELMQVKKFIIE